MPVEAGEDDDVHEDVLFTRPCGGEVELNLCLPLDWSSGGATGNFDGDSPPVSVDNDRERKRLSSTASKRF